MNNGSAKRALSHSIDTSVIDALPIETFEDQVESRHKRIARLRTLWDHRRSLAKAVAIGAVLGALVAFLIPSRFASTAQLMPPDSSSGQGMAMLSMLAGRTSSALGSLGTDFLGLKTSGDLFAGVLQSRTVQDNLINKFDLRKVYGDRRWEQARKDLALRTDISINRKSGIITVQVIDHDPKRAMAMASEYISQLNSVVTQLNTSSAHRERVFLEDRLEQVKSDLTASEKDFSQFASKNGTIDIKEQGKAMVEAAATLEGQLIATQTELQGLRQIYTDQNVRVRAGQARVNELKQQLQRLGGSSKAAATAGDSPEQETYPSLRQLPVLGVTYADLYRRTKVQEIVFETLTQQYELAKVQEAKEVPSIKILDAPEVPEKKVFPPRTIIIAIAGLLGFCVCVMWIFGSHHWREMDAHDPGKLLAEDIYRTIRPGLQPVVHVAERANTRSRDLFRKFRGEAVDE
jgi:capsule polysaccharide export protein KpsE/RkpR